MALFIDVPTSGVISFNVESERDLEFGFDIDPDQMQVVGRTLVITVDGKQIFLNNYFAGDGSSHVETMQLPSGDVISAQDFVAVLMSNGQDDGGIETAADAVGNTGGAVVETFTPDYGLVGGIARLSSSPQAPSQPPQAGRGRGGRDGYDTSQPQPSATGDPATTDPGLLVDYESDSLWIGFYVAQDAGSAGIDPTNEYAFLMPMNRSYESYEGGSGEDTLVLTDTGNGDALFLDDGLSFHGAGLDRIEVVDAGAGDDLVDLSSKTMTYGDVAVYGGEGDDTVWANAGDDTLEGGDGNDILVGGSGSDIVIGGNDADRVYGGQGSDLIHGGEGNDTVYGGDGSDVIFAGEGNDLVNAGSGYHDEVTLGNGADTVTINSTNVTDGWNESLVSILDFNVEQDVLDLAGFNVLDVESGEDHTAVFVGDDVEKNNTWIVLHGVDNSELSSVLGDVNYTDVNSHMPDPTEYITQHVQETDIF